MSVMTVTERDAELKRILWALQDNQKAIDGLLEMARADKSYNAVRYAAMTMCRDGISNGITFARQATSELESQ